MNENDNDENLNLLTDQYKKPISHEDKEEKDNLIEIFKRLEKELVKNNNCKVEFDLNKKDDEFDKCEIFGNPICYNCSKSKKDDKNIQIFYCSHCNKLFCRECLYQHNYSDFESITDVHIKFLKSKKEIMKKKIKENVNRYFLVFIFNIIIPGISALQLAPIFTMNIIKDTLLKVMESYFKHFLNNEKKVENFYILLIKNLGTLNFDFNLLMIMNFLGDKLYQSLGFLKSSLIFYFVNFYVFLIFFNFQGGVDEEYSFLQILKLLIIYLFLCVSIGSYSLLPQKIIIDSNKIYDEYLKDKERKKEEEEKLNSNNNQMILDNINEEENGNKNNLESIKKETENLIKEKNKKMKEKGEKLKLKKNKKENEKFNSFYVISGATMLGYGFSCYINTNKLEYFMNKIEKIRNKTNITYFNDEIFIDNNETITNETDIKINEIYRYFVSNVYLYNFYFIFILIILYGIYLKIFAKNKKNKDIAIENKENVNKNELNEINNNNSYSMFKICGYIYYSENIPLKGNKSCLKKFLNCLILIFYTGIDCLDGTFCNILNIIFYRDEQKCKCCFKYNEKYFNKDNQRFCFFYKEKRGLKWLYDYINSEAQKEISPYMLEYFILKALTLGFEKRYNEIRNNYIFDFKKNQNQNYKKAFYIVGFTFTFSLYLATLFGKSDIKKINKFQRKDSILKNINASNKILNGIHIFLLINSIISLVFSIYYLVEGNSLDDYIIIPILIQKSFYFVFNFYRSCISEEQKGYELIMSASILITIYIIFWDFVIYVLTNIIPYNTILYIIQISLSIIIILVFIYYFIFSKLCLIIFNNNTFCNFCCCLNYSIFCVEGNCICDCCCCNIDSNCYCSFCENFYTCNCCKCCNDNNGTKYITTPNDLSSIEENLIK